MNAIKSFALSLMFIAMLASPALAADTSAATADLPAIGMPSGVSVELPNDYSASIFSQLLGPAWSAICGTNTTFGGSGQYSGLILAILQVLNIAGLTGASVLVLYQWGVFAVATAHSGKQIGGGIYSSLWVPVRSALGFTLCVPVLHGLSLLQFFTIAAIGLGVNTGNLIWQTASTYVIQHVGAGGTTTDTQSPRIDNEAVEIIQPLFQGVLLQEVFVEQAKLDNELGKGLLWTKIKEYHEPSAWSQWRTIEIVRDLYVIEHRPLEGEVILWIRPCWSGDLGSFGGVSIPAPVATLRDGKVVLPDNPETYNAAFAITQIRLNAMIKVADALRPWALFHLNDLATDIPNPYPRPSGDGLTIAEDYRKNVSAAIAAQIAGGNNSKKISEKLAQALGQKAPGETPDGGWIGAGVLPTILSYASAEADIINYGGGVKPVTVDATTGVYSSHDSTLARFVNWWKGNLHVPDYLINQLQKGPRFATQTLLAGRSWTGNDAEGKATGVVNQAITYLFTDGNVNNNGILAETMRDFQEKNPLSALIDFGGRCLTFAGWAMGASAVIGLASVLPGAAGAIAGLMNNSLFVGAIAGVGLVGILCTFIGPLTPLIIWARGVLGWFCHAILALLGAPLLCIAMLFPEGAGFAGQHARKGFVQLLDIAIRPAIMTACLCVAYVLLQSWAAILGILFAKFANASSGYASTGVIWQLGMSIMYVIMVYTAVGLVFKYVVLSGPQSIITWIGGIGMSLGAVEQSADKDLQTGGGTAAKGAAAAAGAGAAIGSAAGNYRDSKEKGGNKGDRSDTSNIAPKAE